METLTQDTAAFSQLLGALQNARSIAAEGGYLDLLGPNKELGLPGIDPMVGDDRTVLLLHSLATGERECNDELWLNLAYIVLHSPAWTQSLAVRGYEMPTPGDILAATTHQATASA